MAHATSGQAQVTDALVQHHRDDLVEAYEREDLVAVKTAIVRHLDRGRAIGVRALETAGGTL